MNGKEAVSYIHSVSWMGSRPGLERITRLASLMGDPQHGMKFIHVAGTNGKGSFCAMTDSMLRAAGYKVGLFTSPYVVEFNERIRVDGENISDSDLGEVTEYVKSFADTMEESPTEFELLTAIAFEHFKRQSCDVVVLETGMGGRLDSTNIIKDPILTVITGISLDHTGILGDTVEKIAAEKSGIIKTGRPVLLGPMDECAKAVICAEADAKGSTVSQVDLGRVSEAVSNLDGNEFVFDGCEKYILRLLGDYQIRNAALALSGAEMLAGEGFAIPLAAKKAGLERVVWRARFELLGKDPVVIYDGGHNPQGVAAAADNVVRFFGKGNAVVLTGMMADKDHGEMTSRLSEIARVVHTVTPPNPRAMSASELAGELTEAGACATAHSTVEDGVRAAIADGASLSLPVVAIGSLYMYADVAAAVEKYFEDR